MADQLADQFTVLTFDTPGFSRSRVEQTDDISAFKLADQIAHLIKSLGAHPATFYGASSGGVAVLDLVIGHSDIVRSAIVREVAMAGAVALLGNLTALNDAEIVETCKFLFAQVMNDDPTAWEALGSEYHARLATNYVTWVRRYVAGGPRQPYSLADLAGKPITWTIGGLTPAGTFFDNVVTATKSDVPITPLMCKHFPQVSAPAMLADHIRANATR